jgi:hypothetical protein
MVTRIPQPQFVGPAPSEAVIQAGSQAQEQAKIFMQGIQNGAQNYNAQQQVKVEQERNKIAEQAQVSESEKLRVNLLGQHLQQSLLTNGPMDYVTNKPGWLDYFGFLAKGDKGLAESMYEGGAGALNQMSGMEMSKAGLIGNAPQASQAAPAIAPQAQAQGQVPASVAPPSSLARPQGMPPQAGPLTATPANGPSTAMSGQVLPQTQHTVSITEVTKGLPKNALTDAANQGLAKIAGLATDPSVTISPKEQTAINSALKPTIQVLKNSQVAAFLAAGGTEETLQRGADQLNQALQNPQFADYFNTVKVMSPKDEQAFNNSMKNDINLQKAIETARYHGTLEERAKTQAAITAFSNILKFQQAQERLRIMATNSKDNQSKLELSKYSLVEKSVKDYDGSMDKFRTDYLAAHKGASDEEVNNYLNTELTRPSSGLRASLDVASQLYGALLGMSAADTEIQLKAQYFLGIPFGFAQTNPGSTAQVPGLPGAGSASSAPSSPRPKLQPGATVVPPSAGGKVVPTQQQKMSDADLLKAAAGQ